MKSTSNARAQDTFTADVVQRVLREKNIPVLIENGGTCPLSLQGVREVLNVSFDAAILRDDDDETVPDDKKVIFYASADLEVR